MEKKEYGESIEKINYRDILENLFSKYEKNEYILNKLTNYIVSLPSILETEQKKLDDRVNRLNELTAEQSNFNKIFLTKNKYFYMQYNNLFYEYNDCDFKIVIEDEILHKLLSSLSDEPKLVQWKHKTMQSIIKQIKDKNLFKAIPESITIQNVISFLNTIFETKTETKYFLTLIGDCILKKNEQNIYFVSHQLKQIISYIDNIICITTGNSIMSNFITKYHDSHIISNYRLLRVRESFILTDIVINTIKSIGINILCVATYYSERYNNADNYIKSIYNDCETNCFNNVLFFYDNSNKKDVVNKFISIYIEPTTNSENIITWKNMHYLWKQYLLTNGLPNILYSNELKEILCLKYGISQENIECPQFKNVTSKLLPSVSNFLNFWDKYVTINTNNINDNLFNEYDIDEIIMLYRSINKGIVISEKNILNIINHYYNIEIFNKSIFGIKCLLWDKQEDIKMFLNHYNNTHKIINIENSDKKEDLVSIYDLYNSYKSFIKAKSSVDLKQYYIVSKSYFEKFIKFYLTENIKFNDLVSFKHSTQQ
jgi:hypothetical protein